MRKENDLKWQRLEQDASAKWTTHDAGREAVAKFLRDRLGFDRKPFVRSQKGVQFVGVLRSFKPAKRIGVKVCARYRQMMPKQDDDIYCFSADKKKGITGEEKRRRFIAECRDLDAEPWVGFWIRWKALSKDEIFAMPLKTFDRYCIGRGSAHLHFSVSRKNRERYAKDKSVFRFFSSWKGD